MNLSVQQLMERYVQSQRALGRRYAGEERVLLSVRHYLEAQGLTDLDPDLTIGVERSRT